jgi:beta-lactam-binding protein with PASTA domain
MPDDTTTETGGVAPEPTTGSRLTRGLAAGIMVVVIVAAVLWLLLPSSSSVPSSTGAGTSVGLAVPNPSSTTTTVASNGLVNVPSVIGKSQADAAKSLAGSGLLAAHSSQVASEPAGTVITQSPGAGLQVQAGSTVDLVVSSGLGAGTSTVVGGNILVPSVLGLTESAATGALAGAGWGVSVSYAPATAAPQGVVFYQSPGGDTYVTGRGTATIWVCKGAPAPGYAVPPLNK